MSPSPSQAPGMPPEGARDVELVFGLAGAVGSDLKLLSRTLSDVLKMCGYSVSEITLSELIREVIDEYHPRGEDGEEVRLEESPEEQRLESYMNSGNAIRFHCDNPAALAAAAIARIIDRRDELGGKPGRHAYILRSLKRPEEVNLLRRVYGDGFFLIGLYTAELDRIMALAKRFAEGHSETENSPDFHRHVAEARRLARRDDEEAGQYGQGLRDVFQLADLFVALGSAAANRDLHEDLLRFVRLILGDLSETPAPDEQNMFHAFAASLASGALGRQVGAVLIAPTGEFLGVGWNDVPRGGGGLYRAGDHYDARDIKRDRDSTNEHADRIVREILEAGRIAGWFSGDPPSLEKGRAALAKTRVMHLLEFGRTTHAEMEAIVSAARLGCAVRGAKLFTTTFPCHECARLIVTAGIRGVVFVEPYPKSQALELHADAIVFGAATEQKCDDSDCEDLHVVEFQPFIGIGPRRYADLFSMTTASGIRRERKDKDGNRLVWSSVTSLPKVEMLPMSYLELEDKVLDQFKKALDSKDQ